MKALVCVLCCVSCCWVVGEEIGPADVHIVGGVVLQDCTVEKLTQGVWVRVKGERRWYLNEHITDIIFKAVDTPEALAKKLQLENEQLRNENKKLKNLLEVAGAEYKKVVSARLQDWREAEKAKAQASDANAAARQAVSVLDQARQAADAWQREAAKNQVTASIATTQAAISNNNAAQAQAQANQAAIATTLAAYQSGYQEGFMHGRSNSYNHVDVNVRGTINVR